MVSTNLRAQAIAFVLILSLSCLSFPAEPGKFKPELVLQTGHTKTVTAIAMSSDNRWLASGSEDNTIKIWDVATGNVLRTLTGHKNAINAIAIEPQQKRLASSSADNTIKIWDVITGAELQTLGGHNFPVKNVAFSSDGRQLTSVSTDAIKTWDIQSGREVRTHKTEDKYGSGRIILSPDARFVVSGGWVSTGGGFGAIVPGLRSGDTKPYRILEVQTGKELSTFKLGDKTYPGDMEFSPDNRLLAVKIRDEQGTLKLYEASGGREVRTLATSDQYGSGALAFSSDGRTLATQIVFSGGAPAGMIKIWDVASGRELGKVSTVAKSVISAPKTEEAEPLVFSSDGRILASTKANAVELFDVASGSSLRLLMTSEKAEAAGAAQTDPLSGAGLTTEELQMSLGGLTELSDIRSPALHFTSDGSRLISETGYTLEFWDMTTGMRMRNPTSETLILMPPFAFNADRNLLVSMSIEMTGKTGFTIRDATSLRETRTIRPTTTFMPEEIAFGPEGRWVAMEYTDTTGRKQVKLWDSATGQEIRTIQSEDKYGMDPMILSPGGRFMATANVKRGGGFGLGSLKSSIPGLGGSSSGSKYEIKIYDLETGSKTRSIEVQRSIDADPATAPGIFFTPGGNRIVVSDYEKKKPVIQFYETATGKKIGTLSPGGQDDPLGVVTFSADGRLMASAKPAPDRPTPQSSSDFSVTIWDVASGRKIHSLSHTSGIKAMTFSRDAQFAVTVTRDGNKHVWDTQTAEKLATIVHLGYLEFSSAWLVVTPDGLFDGSPEAWKQILWRFSQNTFDVSPVEVFFNEFYFPGLLADIMAGKKPKATVDISQKDRRQPGLNIAAIDPPDTKEESSSRLAKVKVTITEAPAGAQDLRIFRNGSLVKVWRGDLTNNSGLEMTVRIVAGENRLTAYAFNRDNVKSADATLIIKGSADLQRKSTAHIIAIGVNQYANSQYNLKYAVADAQAFSEEVQREQRKLGRFQEIKVIPLFDRDATKANILLALKQLAGVTEPEDAVMIYFAGHGTAYEQRFYLIPHDLGYQGARTSLDKAGLESILAHSISDLELEQNLERVDAQQILFVIDACNSGQALEAEEKRRGPMNSKGLAQLAYEKGMYILTAAQSYQAALEAAQLGHGYLTYSLIEEGLKTPAADSEPKDSQVFLREWLDYATQRVPQMQQERMYQARLLKHELAFVEGEEKIQDTERRSIQQPRVFYRREAETQPLIISKP